MLGEFQLVASRTTQVWEVVKMLDKDDRHHQWMGLLEKVIFLLRWRKRLALHYPLVDIMTNQGIKPNDQLRDSKFTGSVG